MKGSKEEIGAIESEISNYEEEGHEAHHRRSGSADMNEPRVHRHASGENGIFANAYLVELPSGVVAVDATLTETDSKALRAKIESLGKPFLAVLITHGHPDHYNGVTNLVARDNVPVAATAGVDRVIRE